MSIWVCSRWNTQPTNEEKWEVHWANPREYEVADKGAGLRRLPKSDYRECEPPERWVDVTDHVVFKKKLTGEQALACDGFFIFVETCHGTRYRLRKVQILPGGQWAFIVEKREDV